MGFQFWFDFWFPPARHEVIQVDFAKKARSRTARELGQMATNLVAKLTLILFLSPQGERLAAGDRLLALPYVAAEDPGPKAAHGTCDHPAR